MHNRILHPSYHSRVNSAVDHVVESIRRAKLEERLARLGESEWNELIVEAVRTELAQPWSGVATVLKMLRRVA
jgi:hypothetical protein